MTLLLTKLVSNRKVIPLQDIKSQGTESLSCFWRNNAAPRNRNHNRILLKCFQCNYILLHRKFACSSSTSKSLLLLIDPTGSQWQSTSLCCCSWLLFRELKQVFPTEIQSSSRLHKSLSRYSVITWVYFRTHYFGMYVSVLHFHPPLRLQNELFPPGFAAYRLHTSLVHTVSLSASIL
jgi:hypothetical protein